MAFMLVFPQEGNYNGIRAREYKRIQCDVDHYQSLGKVEDGDSVVEIFEKNDKYHYNARVHFKGIRGTFFYSTCKDCDKEYVARQIIQNSKNEMLAYAVSLNR